MYPLPIQKQKKLKSHTHFRTKQLASAKIAFPSFGFLSQIAKLITILNSRKQVCGGAQSEWTGYNQATIFLPSCTGEKAVWAESNILSTLHADPIQDHIEISSQFFIRRKFSLQFSLITIHAFNKPAYRFILSSTKSTFN